MSRSTPSTASATPAWRERSRRRLTAVQAQVLALSHSLHAEPELAYEEHQSVKKIADLMEGAGFDVERGVCDLPTAFIAAAGTGDLGIGICAEYDALPGIGHPCGHHVNGAASVAAAPALAEVADDLGIGVRLLDTPRRGVRRRPGKTATGNAPCEPGSWASPFRRRGGGARCGRGRRSWWCARSRSRCTGAWSGVAGQP